MFKPNEQILLILFYRSHVVIYNNHYLDVYRFRVCFTGNWSDAEDLTQEVFIRVLKNLCNFNSRYNLNTKMGC